MQSTDLEQHRGLSLAKEQVFLSGPAGQTDWGRDLRDSRTVERWLDRAAWQVTCRTRGFASMSPSQREESVATARCEAIRLLVRAGTARLASWVSDEQSHPLLVCVRSAMARAAFYAARGTGLTGARSGLDCVSTETFDTVAKPWLETAQGLADYAARTAPSRGTMATKARRIRGLVRSSRDAELVATYAPAKAKVVKSYRKLERAFTAIVLGESVSDAIGRAGYPIDADGRCRALRRAVFKAKLLARAQAQDN